MTIGVGGDREMYPRGGTEGLDKHDTGRYMHTYRRGKMRVPFETPLHWIIQIGLSTDFRYITCRVRGKQGPYVMPSRFPIALHSPHTLTLLSVTLVRFQVVLVLLLLGDQPNGIVGGRGKDTAPERQ